MPMRPDTEYAMSPSLVAGAVAGSASGTDSQTQQNKSNMIAFSLEDAESAPKYV